MNVRKTLPWDRVPKSTSSRILRSYLAMLDCPRALTVWLLYSDGSNEAIRQLLALDPALPRPFEDVDSFACRYAATKFLSKTEGLNSGIDTEQVALSKAVEAEEQCAQTNRSVSEALLRGTSLGALTWDDIHSIRVKISRVLGRCPDLDQLMSHDMGWSKGRTSACWGSEKTIVHKYMCGKLDITPRAAKMGLKLVNASPLWGAAAMNADGPYSVLHSALEYAAGNTMFVVPKNAKTGRVICYEPHLNIRLQLLVGSFLKSRLLKAGVNLKDQSINQRRAKLASKTGHLCTIDLKSASDTLARAVVELLLPMDWVNLLDDLRSKQTFHPDGTLRLNQKFSSMGNGYTFELESLIFYAALAGVGLQDVSVFGDDIICKAEDFERAKSVLESIGFALNTEKSFSEGRFRESCGADCYFGSIVTPPFLRRPLKTVGDVIHLHNAVRRWLGHRGAPIRGARLLAKWRTLSGCLLVGPMGSELSPYGDEFFHVSFDEASPAKARRGWEGYQVVGYSRQYLDYHWDTDSGSLREGYAWLCATLGPSEVSELNSLNQYGRFRYKMFKGVAPFWGDYIWV